MNYPRWVGFTRLDVLQLPSDPLRLPQPARGLITMPISVFSSHFIYYVFNFNKAFVPMALELRGRLKEYVVILSEVWASAAALSLGEKSFLPVSGQLRMAVIPNWATIAKKVGPHPLYL